MTWPYWLGVERNMKQRVGYCHSSATLHTWAHCCQEMAWLDRLHCLALPCLVRSSDPFTTMLYSAPKHCCDSQWPPSPLMCSRSHTHTRQSLHFKPSDRVNADAGESRRVCKWRSTGLQHLILVEQWTFPELNILKVQLVLDFWIQIEAKEAEAL